MKKINTLSHNGSVINYVEVADAILEAIKVVINPFTPTQVKSQLAGSGASNITIGGVKYTTTQWVKNIINNWSNKDLYLVTLGGATQAVADAITVVGTQLIYTDSKGNETNITSKAKLKAI